MRSIPMAIIWEIFSRGRWGLLAAFLGGNALPALILGALQREGLTDPNDPVFLLMHLTLVQLNSCIFAIGVFHSIGSPSRLYAYPVTSATIVGWHLLACGVLAFADSAVSTVALNALFRLHWPIWGPAMVAATGMVSVLAIVWLTEKSAWIILGLTVGIMGLAFWFKMRYGPLNGVATHYWVTVQPHEVAALVAYCLLAYGVGVIGVSRARRGDPLPALGIWAFIERLLNTGADVSQPLRTPVEAQFWAEWRTKGWAMPAAVVMMAIFGLAVWTIGRQRMDDVFEVTVHSGLFLPILGMVVALIMGNVGTNDGNLVMGQFMATRPLTNTQIARTILKTAGWSVLISWLLWIVAVLVVTLVALANGGIHWKLLDKLEWWFLPFTLLAPWTIVAVGATIGLSGRAKAAAIVACALLGAYLVGMVVAQNTLTFDGRQELAHGLLVAAGVVFVLLTSFLFLRARSRTFIGWPTVGFAMAAWTVLTASIVVDHVLMPTHPLSLAFFATGIGALALAPLAAAPLAIAMNRTR